MIDIDKVLSSTHEENLESFFYPLYHSVKP